MTGEIDTGKLRSPAAAWDTMTNYQTAKEWYAYNGPGTQEAIAREYLDPATNPDQRYTIEDTIERGRIASLMATYLRDWLDSEIEHGKRLKRNR